MRTFGASVWPREHDTTSPKGGQLRHWPTLTLLGRSVLANSGVVTSSGSAGQSRESSSAPAPRQVTSRPEVGSASTARALAPVASSTRSSMAAQRATTTTEETTQTLPARRSRPALSRPGRSGFSTKVVLSHDSTSAIGRSSRASHHVRSTRRHSGTSTSSGQCQR